MYEGYRINNALDERIGVLLEIMTLAPSTHHDGYAPKALIWMAVVSAHLLLVILLKSGLGTHHLRGEVRREMTSELVFIKEQPRLPSESIHVTDTQQVEPEKSIDVALDAPDHTIDEPMPLPVVPPSDIDWEREAATAARGAVTPSEGRPRALGPSPNKDAAGSPRPDGERTVPWRRRMGQIERTPEGDFVVWINDNCFYRGVAVVCKIGKKGARGDLFDDLKKDHLETDEVRKR